MAALLFAFLSL